MKKLLFIINPVAGKKHAGSSMYNVVKRFCSAGYNVTIAVTQYKGHGRELAASAADEGYDLVVCTASWRAAKTSPSVTCRRAARTTSPARWASPRFP